MRIATGVWSVTHNGKHLQIEHAKRLPRKTKKFISLVFEGAGDMAKGFVMVSAKLSNSVEGKP
jgi:hypothetical protein